MKKHLLLFSLIAVMSLTGCHTDGGQSSSQVEEPPSSESSSSTPVESSVSSSSSSASSVVPYSGPKEEGNTNANFTLTMPTDVSSMSTNCKKYVDDMRAQHQKLVQEKGANADYYLNDLYGNDGVDMTKGITEGDNGGYRPANVENEYLDPVTAEWV